MIRPLRKKHLAASMGLLLILPAIVVTAISVRPDKITDQLPTASATPLSNVVHDATHSVSNVSIKAVVTTDQEARSLVLELTPEHALRQPDLLAYWSPDATIDTGYLLGSLRGSQTVAFNLPAGATQQDGHVIVYSLGHGNVAGTFPLSLSTSLGNR